MLWSLQLFFEYYFNKLSKREKILSFLLIPLILFFIYIEFDKYVLSVNKKNIDNKIKILKKINSQSQKQTKLNQLDIVQFIEQIASKFNIKIINLDINRKIFTIDGFGNYLNVINFISNLEQNMKIVTLSLSRNNKKIQFNISLKSRKIKNKSNIIVLNNLPNPFYKKKKHTISNKLILSAIIGNNICINNKWYTKNDKIGKYKIVDINKYSVKLKYKKQNILLKLPYDK
jgi:hypothetical protein